MKRALQENGSSSTTTKKSKTKKYKEEPASESFVCRWCLQEIARAHDLLATFDFQMEPNGIVGLFRRVLNVDREQAADPGFDVFIANVFCSRCFNILGSLIVRGEHSVAGNYVIAMNCLWIRRGILVADAVTRELVGYI